MADKEKPNTEVFVVSAIGADDSPQRIHADWLLEGIVDPVFETHFKDFTVSRADRIGTPGLIDAQIIDKLLTARLVIADLTFLNPNAFYEIGIRHVVNLPIIHVHRADQSIPFDISLFRSIRYSTERPQHLVAAQESLRKTVIEVLADDYAVENPVTQARGRKKFAETASAADRVLESEVQSIRKRLQILEKLALENYASPTPRGWALGLAPGAAGLGRAQMVERIRFELEDQMENATLMDFREMVLAPYMGQPFETIKNTPRSIEIEYPWGSLAEDDLARMQKHATHRGIIMQKL